MPSHLVQRIDLDKLYPPFLEKLLNVLAACEAKGQSYVATQGYRTNAEQAKLYFQGRTLPGEIVTNARPGYSLHNWGIAADVALDKDLKQPGLQPDWAPSVYKMFADMGDDHGLQVNVASGTDYGHIQLPVHRKTNRSERAVLELLKGTGSLKAAWALLDVLGPW